VPRRAPDAAAWACWSVQPSQRREALRGWNGSRGSASAIQDPGALAELAKAAELAPDDPRHAYVWAVALHDTGDVEQWIRVLERAHDRAPASRDVLVALVQFETARGNRAAAAAWARDLVAVTDDESARRLLRQLEEQGGG
jgi:Flp pilus assembly protein TadD